jgi:hypothetical protein
VRFFVFGLVVGAGIGAVMTNLLTQYVEHGDVLYPARIRISRKGKHVNFELLQQ